MSHRHHVAGLRHALIHYWPLLAGGLVLALLATILLATSIGAITIPLQTVGRIIASHLGGSGERTWSAGHDNIVWEVRLPRALLGAIVGASLAIVGTALQSVTRNTLADPHLLGISSGAALGAIIVLMHTGMVFGLITVPLVAFAGALASTFLVAGLAHLTQSTDAARLVLTGVAVSFVLSALASLAIFLGDPRAAHTVIFWMLGGLGLAQWTQLPYPLAALLLAGTYLLTQGGNLNAMTLGDETATTLGIPAGRFRVAVFIACALLTGAAVAFSGVISFIGLMTPHLVRLVIGGDNRRVLPLSAMVGAIFLVLADLLSRILMPPQDMPLGIITGLIGGIFFIALMARRR
jgi:iron complex transport system permease protein